MEKKDKTLNVPHLRFPEFSGEWVKARLGDVCKFFSGGTPSSTNKDFYDGDIPFIRSGEIHSNSTELYITEAGLNSSSAKIVEQGDLLLALYGATSGDIAISKIKGAINQAILCIRTNHDNFFLKSCWEKHCEKLLQTYLQGGQGNLSAEIVKSIKMAFPSCLEQKKISGLLSLIEERISTQKKIIEKYESLIRGLYQFLFQQAKYDHFVSLGDISQISNGNSDVKDASMYNDGSLYPFFDRSDEIKFLPEYLFDKEAIIYPGEGAEFYPRYYNGKFALHQRCYAVYDISTDFIPRYLYHYCKTQNSYFVRNAVGSTVASLRLDTFKRLKIPAIPTHHQESLVMFLDKIEAKIECNRTILKKYEEQKKYLLFTLFI